MRLWDGYDRNRNETTRFNINDARWIYYIADNGAIFYADRERPEAEARVWCPASMLTAHLHRLWQIRNRYN